MNQQDCSFDLKWFEDPPDQGFHSFVLFVANNGEHVLMCVTVILIFVQDFEAFDNALEEERLEEFLKL